MITEAFEPDSEALIRPEDIAAPVPDFPETVLVTFSQRMLDCLQTRTELKQVSSMQAGAALPVYRFEYAGKALGIYRTGLGGAAAAALLEEVFVKGARRALVFGSCGVLDKGIAAGKLILPTFAYRDEGTSYHYLPAGDYVPVSTADKLARLWDELKIPYLRGKTWTTDAFYRETRGSVEKRRREGCVCVEMECASLMAVAAFRGREVYQFLYGADSLDGESWDARILGCMPATHIERVLETALDTAVRLE